MQCQYVTTKSFYHYELDGKKIAFHQSSIIELQESKGKSKYKTIYRVNAIDFGSAVMAYNMKSAFNGYNKRLICRGLNKPILARKISAK